MSQDKQKLPLKLKIASMILKMFDFPEMPVNPKKGKWYRISMPECVSAGGGPVHAGIRIGTENKLMILFHGGGVSWNEHMAAGGYDAYTPEDGRERFYATDGDTAADIIVGRGITSNKKDCAFRNWSVISIPYGTGDFHCGTADFSYTERDGSRAVLHHHGYTNYRKIMDKAITYVGKEPEQIIVTGFSAGGFGTALLTDDVMKIFPKCKDVICYVDSGFMLFDGWHEVAKKVWKAPKEICDRLVSNNITLDCMKALKRDHGDKVKILFSCSTRDVALSDYWNYVNKGKLYSDRETGLWFQKDLKQMCQELLETIPDAGVFLFDSLVADNNHPEKREAGLTQHCINISTTAEKTVVDGTTLVQWLSDAAEGRTACVGLSLLEQ